jgi:hypothetical protein
MLKLSFAEFDTHRRIIRRRIGSSQRTVRQPLEEIVRSQHHRSFSLDWPFEELMRCSLLNRIAQSHKLIYSLICLHIMLAFKIVHCRGADRTPHYVALIKHCEINDHPIEVVAQHFTSLQRHCNSPVLQGSDYVTTGGHARGAGRGLTSGAKLEWLERIPPMERLQR